MLYIITIMVYRRGILVLVCNCGDNHGKNGVIGWHMQDCKFGMHQETLSILRAC